MGNFKIKERNHKFTEDLVSSAIELIKEDHVASLAHFQRKMNLGYGCASELIEELQEQGIIGDFICRGTNFREILIQHGTGEKER